ncbi:MAG: ribosome small subunit-dependent GTPase A [Clostridia bacterium]|nr:ribosome small subunit-dependent GTPase A [Clostridia bacterium]
MTREGQIIKCVAGVYDVLCGQDVFSLRAAGRFRGRGITPLVGDRVLFDDEGFLTQVVRRRNELTRPPLANVDTLIITVAVHTPEPDRTLADKLICFCRARGITPLLCVNKCDLDPAQAQRILREYEMCGIAAVRTSLRDDRSIEALRQAIPDGTACFCGQSAVGKSSLTNALLGKSRFQTGGLSKKTERGRHTTRHCELVRLSNTVLLADTPGFSLLEMPLLSPEDFRDLYAEYAPFAPECRFHGCFHDREPGCAVKQAVDEGRLSAERYRRYTQLLQEVKEKWGMRYD